jgi:hypothetical protein
MQLQSITDNPVYNTKMHSSDRVFRLTPIGDVKDTNGIIDKRLFSGENKLHALMDTQTCLWSLKYEMGGLPNPLKQQFTSFSRLLTFVTEYFKRRNVEVKEVIDN